MEAFLGEIRLFPWGWAPDGWLPCEGQLLDRNNRLYIALGVLLGTRYGGDGRLTFGLPDLRGRAAMGVSADLNTQPLIGVHELGSSGGTTVVTLTAASLPSHSHAAHVLTTLGNTGPANCIPAVSSTVGTGTTPPKASKPTYASAAGAELVALNSATVDAVEGSKPLSNVQPSIGACFCICIAGAFPPR